MARVSSGHAASWSEPAAPPTDLAQFMRPVMPLVTAEITEEIQRRIVEFGPGASGVALTSTKLVIALAVRYFVDHVENPDAPRDELDETLRRLGRGFAYDGRSLETLREAYQIGARVAWTRLREVAEDAGVPAAVLGGLGEQLYAFIDSLSVVSTHGHHEAQAQLTDAAQQWRGRVLDLVLAGAARAEIAAAAATGNWTVPDTVALVAVLPDPGRDLPRARMLHPRTLASLHGEQPAVLLPAPVGEQLRAELTTLFAGHRIAVGCEVPLADAAQSLRWARRALELARDGVLPDEPVIDCRRHVGALWIHAEPLLADLVVSSTLAPLFAEPRHSRRILGQTLLAWITVQNASAPALAETLGVHPQTVRYRLKRLREIFGDLIDEPHARLEMFFALTATGPLWNDGVPITL